jgi:hypothetical protein
MSHDNLLAGPAPVELPDDFPGASARLAAGEDPAAVAAEHPASSLAWAVLAERSLAAAGTAPDASAPDASADGAGNGADGAGNTAGNTSAPAGNALAAPVQAYAYARTGYHRGLDALRRAGWRGQGPIPVAHEPHPGFLRCRTRCYLPRPSLLTI